MFRSLSPFSWASAHDTELLTDECIRKAVRALKQIECYADCAFAETKNKWSTLQDIHNHFKTDMAIDKNPKFKVGDRVIGNGLASSRYTCTVTGWRGVVTEVNGGEISVQQENKPLGTIFPVLAEFFDLIKDNKTTMSSIKERFALAMTPEPQKTFRKLGITNGDNVITDEGQTLLLTWLLGKNQEAFKAEVCDPILKEQESK